MLIEARKPILVSLFFSIFSGQIALADHYSHFWQNRQERFGAFSLTPSFYYWNSGSNYASTGDSFLPQGFDGYSRFGLDLDLAWSPIRKLTFFGRLNWVRNENNHVFTGGDSFGFGDQMAGANFKVFEFSSGIALHIQSQFDFAVYDNKGAQTDGVPFLGDGSNDITNGLFVTVPIIRDERKTLNIMTGAAYMYRSSLFSNAMPYYFHFDLRRKGRGFNLGLGLVGLQSFDSDNSQDVSGSTPTVGGGGSFAINAIAPSFTAIRATGGYRFGPRSAIGLSVHQTLFGAGAPKGTGFHVGFKYSFYAASRTPRTRVEIETRGNKKFKTYGLEARIVSTNDRLSMVKIDKGLAEGVKKGDSFDIFSVKNDGTLEEAVARARVRAVKENQAVLKIKEYYKEVWIDKGFIVRQSIE